MLQKRLETMLRCRRGRLTSPDGARDRKAEIRQREELRAGSITLDEMQSSTILSGDERIEEIGARSE
jgi:hypothetical protein